MSHPAAPAGNAAGPTVCIKSRRGKEDVKVREGNQTVASITFQNYFRLYAKIVGMTGTADTEAFESSRSTSGSGGRSRPTSR